MKLPAGKHKFNSITVTKSLIKLLLAIASGTTALIFSSSTQVQAQAQQLDSTSSGNPSVSQAQKGFICDNSSGVPTTVYYNGQGISEPWIKWVSEHFSESKWTPQARCETVSQRLEQYRQEGRLKYVTLGVENEQQIICVASRDNGPCEGIIYTLKPGQDGIAALNNLFAWGSGQQNLESNYESSGLIPYINVGARLNGENN